jgi:hypothetical protein
MAERSRAPIPISTLRIGPADLGDATIVIDEDAITLTVRAMPNERPIRMALAMVTAVQLAGSDVSLRLRDGTRLALVSPNAAGVHEELLLRCRTLPEVTRALRAFGSRRGQRSARAAAASDQAQFFAPLLEARRKAGGAGGPTAVIAAFDASELKKAIETSVTAFVTDRHAENGPARRAFEAELTDLAEPLLLALQELGEAAARATESIDDLSLWRAWSAQLRATFEVADRVWLTLDDALEVAPRPGSRA